MCFNHNANITFILMCKTFLIFFFDFSAKKKPGNKPGPYGPTLVTTHYLTFTASVIFCYFQPFGANYFLNAI